MPKSFPKVSTKIPKQSKPKSMPKVKAPRAASHMKKMYGTGK